jgi:hypothetical protein
MSLWTCQTCPCPWPSLRPCFRLAGPCHSLPRNALGVLRVCNPPTPESFREFLHSCSVYAVGQLCGSDGTFHVVRHDLGQTFTLRWDNAILPNAVVHISNNGRACVHPPLCFPFPL